MITKFGWTVFQYTGSIEAYLLYRDCQDRICADNTSEIVSFSKEAVSK